MDKGKPRTYKTGPRYHDQAPLRVVSTKLHRRARSKRRAASSDSICFEVPALAMDTSELGRTGCFRWIHGLDPLTRLRAEAHVG
jgi:hypothetical protein